MSRFAFFIVFIFMPCCLGFDYRAAVLQDHHLKIFNEKGIAVNDYELGWYEDYGYSNFNNIFVDTLYSTMYFTHGEYLNVYSFSGKQLWKTPCISMGFHPFGVNGVIDNGVWLIVMTRSGDAFYATEYEIYYPFSIVSSKTIARFEFSTDVFVHPYIREAYFSQYMYREGALVPSYNNVGTQHTSWNRLCDTNGQIVNYITNISFTPKFPCDLTYGLILLDVHGIPKAYVFSLDNEEVTTVPLHDDSPSMPDPVNYIIRIPYITVDSMNLDPASGNITITLLCPGDPCDARLKLYADDQLLYYLNYTLVQSRTVLSIPFWMTNTVKAEVYQYDRFIASRIWSNAPEPNNNGIDSWLVAAIVSWLLVLVLLVSLVAIVRIYKISERREVRDDVDNKYIDLMG